MQRINANLHFSSAKRIRSKALDHDKPTSWFGLSYPDLESLHIWSVCIPFGPLTVTSRRELSISGKLSPCEVLAADVDLSDVVASCLLLGFFFAPLKVECVAISDKPGRPSLAVPASHRCVLASVDSSLSIPFCGLLDLPSLSSIEPDRNIGSYARRTSICRPVFFSDNFPFSLVWI